MTESTRSNEKPLRMNVEAFRARQEVQPSIVLDVRDPKDWDRSETKIPGALRADLEIRTDPHWPRDRLTLAY